MSATPLYRLPYPNPLLRGTLLGRYKRFSADVRLDDGTVVTAHCVNTGRMEGLTLPGRRVFISPANNPKRKLRYTWEIVEVDDVMVGANTAIPNTLVGAMLRDRVLPGLDDWTELVPERKVGEKSRTDFWLKTPKGEHFIEVKNCHLVYPDGHGYFPDSVSARAAKHMGELAELASKGHQCTVIFTGQRADTRAIRPSDAHDPDYAAAARLAARAGVDFRALRIRPTERELVVECEIPVDLEPYDLTDPRRWREELRAEAPGWTAQPPPR